MHWIRSILSNNTAANVIICNILERRTQNSFQNSLRCTNQPQHQQPIVTFILKKKHCLHEQKHSTCHSCVLGFVSSAYNFVHVISISKAEIASTLYHDRNSNELCDIVGQQRDRKRAVHSTHSGCFASIIATYETSSHAIHERDRRYAAIRMPFRCDCMVLTQVCTLCALTFTPHIY